MDFIRAVVKQLFCGCPLPLVERIFAEGKQHDVLSLYVQEVLKRTLMWSEQEFSATELDNLIPMVLGREKTFSDDYPFFVRIFGILLQFSENVLVCNGKEPLVKFEHLLRWHELSKVLGEDILVTSYLAEQDIKTNKLRTGSDLSWPDILNHDNKSLNTILEKGLQDVHSHLTATADICNLNWIGLMNRYNSDVLADKFKFSQQPELAIIREKGDFAFNDWILIAAMIRINAFKVLSDNGCGRFDSVEIDNVFKNPDTCQGLLTILRCEIATQYFPNGYEEINPYWDYAIINSDWNSGEKKNAFFMLLGERRLMYLFFRALFAKNDNAIRLAPYFYMYLLVKALFRKEIIQNNSLVGFENFALYQKRKSSFVNDEILWGYAIRSTLDAGDDYGLETRVVPAAIHNVQNMKPIFPFLGRYSSDDVSIVCHLIKGKNKKWSDVASARHKAEKAMDKVLHHFHKNRFLANQDKPLLVGIDAAGSEFNQRPETYGTSFRWAVREGLTNVTFHAGEDFYDLVDGLRTIDEAIRFLQLGSGNRIGHALAMGTDSKSYYQQRHYNVIIPKQLMLDNMVWILYTAQRLNVAMCSEIQYYCETTAKRLLREIGYKNDTVTFDLYDYWQSMLLRSDGIDDDMMAATPKGMTRECRCYECDEARHNNMALILKNSYLTDKDIIEKGHVPETFLWPHSIKEVVGCIQEAMMREIERKDIYIECNPSSNLKIGHSERYDELPILRFFDIDDSKHSINVSVNTDDRGVFATSLRNEYSLLALAMMKMKDDNDNKKYTAHDVYNYIQQIVKNCQIQRFKVDNNMII